MSNSDNINNKELLFTAINGYDHFNKSQKAIVNIILDFEDNGTANIPISSITAMAGFSKTIIYKSLNKLEEMNVIKRERKDNEKIACIQINPEKIQEILNYFLKKQKILTKGVTK